MRSHVDTTALVIGLVGLLIAALGLWIAFGAVNWSWVGVAVPLLLVVFGLAGLFASRSKS